MPEVEQAAENTEKEAPNFRTVTSENYDAFVNHKMGIDPEEIAAEQLAKLEAEKAAAEQKAKAEEEDPTVTLEEHEGDEKIKNKRKGLQGRFSELTTQRNEAREAAEAARAESEKRDAEIAELRKSIEEMRNRYEPPKELGERPKSDDFQDIESYSKALEEWAAEKAIADKQATDYKEKAEREQKAMIDRFTANQKEFMESNPDYQQVLNAASDITVSDEVKAAILDAENGPEILYSLAKDKDFAKSLSEMPAHRALREIGKMEAKLTKRSEAEQDQENTPISEVSKAPAPIRPLSGSGSATALKGSDEAPKDYQTFKKMRRQGLIK